MVHSSVKTVDRLVRILDCFSPSQPTWSLAELSLHLGLPKSTLHRFLASLESHGILRRELANKRWCLGYRPIGWGELAAKSTGLRHIAKPILHELVAATGETAILTVYQGQEVMCIEKVETDHSVRMTLDVGTRRPPHAGASCKILMAYLPEEEIQAIIQEKGLSKLCTNTITDPEELLVELARIRECGYAESCEETDIGAQGVATAIFNRDREVVAAVGITGPSPRFTDELAQQYITYCHQVAERISALLSTGVESKLDRLSPTHRTVSRVEVPGA